VAKSLASQAGVGSSILPSATNIMSQIVYNREANKIVITKTYKDTDWHSGYPITREVSTTLTLEEARLVKEIYEREALTIQRDNQGLSSGGNDRR
jgi:hypothetical protein